MGEQRREHVGLAAREVVRDAADAHAHLRDGNRQVGRRGIVERQSDSPEDVARARDQLAIAERAADAVVCTGLQSLDALLLTRIRRDRQDRHQLTHFVRDRERVESFAIEFDDRQPEGARAETVERCTRIGEAVDMEAGVLERATDRGGVQRIGFDECQRLDHDAGEVGAFGLPDIYEAAYTSFDIVLAQSLGRYVPGVDVKLAASNILGARREFVQGGEIQRMFDPGRKVSLSFSYTPF